jgi:hypothetical protein
MPLQYILRAFTQRHVAWHLLRLCLPSPGGEAEHKTQQQRIASGLRTNTAEDKTPGTGSHHWRLHVAWHLLRLCLPSPGGEAEHKTQQQRIASGLRTNIAEDKTPGTGSHHWRLHVNTNMSPVGRLKSCTDPKSLWRTFFLTSAVDTTYDRLCGLVVRYPGCRSRDAVLDSGATRFPYV